jgi:hypothetical protein
MNASDLIEGMLAADTLRQRREKMLELERDIARVGKSCGDCDKWMKSSLCPRERNVGGMSRGPSCGEAICQAFQIADSAIRHRDRLTTQLQTLRALS